MLATLEAFLESRAFRIFFAVWTGAYLVSLFKREDKEDLGWIVFGAVVVFLL